MNSVGGFDMPQPFSPPPGGQIQPGAITYTTSTGPDGQVIYHPFRAVPARYQTPQGVVSGIQWVPAEATQILPAGATPANAEFAASWNRGYISRDDEKALEKWQKSEEKRRRREEKDSIKRLSKQFDKDMTEVELRAACDRELQTRERRRSFYGGAPPAPPPGYGAPGSAPYGAYAHSPSNFTSVELDRKFTELDIGRDVKYTTRQRKYSTSGGDRTSMYPPPAPSNVYPSPAVTYQNPTGYPGTGSSPYNRATSPFRSSPNPRPQEVSSYPGAPDPIARAASPYGRSEPIARSASPYGRPPTEPIARAASPYGRPPTEPIARAASPYGLSHPPYNARAPSPAPPPRGLPPQRSTSPFPRAPSPYVPPQFNPSGYTPGHVLDGPSLSRSRAPSPMPGMPSSTFPTSPRMPSSAMGAEQQLTAPEAFSRPANAAQSYTPFNTMKIQDMEQFYDQIPRMPLVLETHDIYHQDWIRLMNDLALAWAGKMPIPDFSRGPLPKRSVLVADLIDLWNSSFFLTRRVEVVLYKGRERRSGANAGTIDYNLPGFQADSSDDSSSSLSSDSESESDRYAGYGRGVDLTESRRRHRERKEEKRRRKKEKKLRRKAKELEKTYSLYLMYVHPRDIPIPAQHGYYA